MHAHSTAWRTQKDDRATLTVGEIQQEGSCGVMDPEVGYASCSLPSKEAPHLLNMCLIVNTCVQDPTCAKVSISGRMRVVPKQGLREAEEMLFQRHPQMRDWPVSAPSAFKLLLDARLQGGTAGAEQRHGGAHAEGARLPGV